MLSKNILTVRLQLNSVLGNGNHPIVSNTEKGIKWKIDHLHNNPLAAAIVCNAEDYLF